MIIINTQISHNIRIQFIDGYLEGIRSEIVYRYDSSHNNNDHEHKI